MDKLKDIQDLTEKVVQKKPINVDDALRITTEIAHQLQGIGDNIRKTQLARGAVLESSTHIEKVFDEILVNSNQSKMVSSARFMEKARFIKKLMETFDPEKKILTDDFLEKLEKVVIIRNLFAHVPINYFQEELEFDSSVRYTTFFKGDLSLRGVKKSSSLFREIAQEILQKTTEFIKIVLKAAEEQKRFMESIQQVLKEISNEEVETS